MTEEKIKELAKQAGLTEDRILENFGFNPNQFKWTGNGANIIEFANLLIKEYTNE